MQLSFAIESKFTHYTYTVDVFVPEMPRPPEGFPVIFVLDGLHYFDYVKKTIELQCKNMAKTKVSPAVVVGVNHGKETMRSRRFHDFTAPSETYLFPDRMKNKTPESMGGAEEFHDFIEHELKPFIYRSFPVDISKAALFGHSLSGYFTLWSLFRHPGCYRDYIALSPSIWWNDKELFGMADTFLNNGELCRRLFIGVGELEGFMVDDARELAALLKSAELPVQFFEALDENHASVVPAVISRALRYING